jgi:general secretion pathway protein I
MNMPRISPKEKGFTLLEVLIALVILAVAAAGLMSAMRQSVVQQERLEIKAFATWVAQNRLAELHAARDWPGVGEGGDTLSMAGRDWNVRVIVEDTPNPDIRKVTVGVSAAAPRADTSAVTLTGFLGRN